MKILYINDFAPNFPGSFFESLYALSKKLKERNDEVFFIFPIVRDYIKRLDALGKVHYCPSFMEKKIDLNLFKLVYQICKTENIDIIHTNFGFGGFLVANLISVFLNIKHIAHERNPSSNYIKEKHNRTKQLRALIGFTLIKCIGITKYIAISSYVKKSLLHYNRIEEKNIVVIPNAVLPERNDKNIDLENYTRIERTVQNNKVVGMTAHLGPQKDHKTLVDAAEIICQRFPNILFLLIGGNLVKDKSNFREQIAIYIKEKNLEHNFYFVGEVQDPMPYLELFDIGCLISNWEGFGNALVEYMLKKKPVIGTAVGGIKDIIEDGVNGFLIPPKRYNLLAEKIIYLIENPNVAKEMGENGYQKALREYNMDIWVNRIINLYEEVNGKK